MRKYFLLLAIMAFGLVTDLNAQEIPLPEHPRPDFERAEWLNLNGEWSLTFDSNVGTNALQTGNFDSFNEKITVPFPWGSKLSGVRDGGDCAWYARSVKVPETWRGKRIFVVVGASDWGTEGWFAGHKLGSHQGGYTPFEFEITDYVQYGKEQPLMFAIEDKGGDDRLYGKQGYGNVRGIWQTVYLEARGSQYIEYVHFSPDIDNSKVKVRMKLNSPVKNGLIRVAFKNGEQGMFSYYAAHQERNSDIVNFDIKLKDQHLWDLDDPYLYEMSVSLCKSNGTTIDAVNTYFGQRKISTSNLPGFGYPYIALNNKPIYLQLCLDQSYHPEGFYTFPSDEFIKNEIMISKNLGLSGNRVHIKVEVPRKLYWADKLGLLIMADTPNFWGNPVPSAQQDWENCMRGQVCRDYNHPSIFAWVNFNETWGLFTNFADGRREYTKETQEWVRSMYYLTKRLDPTRLVEDNSACNEDHVITDINSWHAYHPGYRWISRVKECDENTYPGSRWNYIGGNRQENAPMINSECGNVWGYHGAATGDCDYTWDYHIMIDNFRKHPKVAGWLYTEHHDVINEWNGYVQYDRSPKVDGLDDIVPGMTLKDFHSKYYIVPDKNLATIVRGGTEVEVPLYASFNTDKNPGKLKVVSTLVGWNSLGEKKACGTYETECPFEPYLHERIGAVNVRIPDFKGLYVLQTILKDGEENVLHRNFTCFKVNEGKAGEVEGGMAISFLPDSYSDAQWSIKFWEVMSGLKVNGAGSGYFEYRIAWPQELSLAQVSSAELRFEAGAKELFGKDKDGASEDDISGDFMLGKGTFDHCISPNSYAMTDTDKFPSKVRVEVNGTLCGEAELEDDPADHRGLLSWAAQKEDFSLRDAGSYGYLVNTEINPDLLKEGEDIVIRLSVPQECKGGLAIYGSQFGRYPLDPTIIFYLR